MMTRECSRPGCNNYMCSRRSETFGFLCSGCFDDLVRLGPSADIATFMQTQPASDSGYTAASEAYFREIFPRLTTPHNSARR